MFKLTGIDILKKLSIVSFLVVACFIAILSSRSLVYAADNPGYRIEWSDETDGKFPVKLTSDWFSGFKTASSPNDWSGSKTITIKESQAGNTNSPEDLIFARIRANVSESNKECVVQISVDKEKSNDTSFLIVDAIPSDRVGGEKCNSSVEKALDKNAYINKNGTTSTENTPNGSNGNTTTTTAAAEEDTDTSGGDSCESNGGAMSWILCPVITMVDNTLAQIDIYVQELLTVNFLNKGKAHDSLKKSWVNIRNLAYVILVPIMLVMVIGTAIGSQYVDAYTVKKAFPRMIVAIIFIALSWYLCVFFINFVDVLGSGIRGIILSPFYTPENVPENVTLASLLSDAGILNSGSGASGVAQAGSGLLVVGVAMITGLASIGIILSTIASIAIILGIAFMLLVARQIIIMALLLISPLAILSWIFPGNDKLWKFWWGAFSKLLFLFPVIMAMIAMGAAFANIVTGL